MKKMMSALALAALLSVSVPSVAFAQFAVTPSGRAEMVFVDTTVADTVSQLQSACMTQGFTVISSQGNQLVCELPMGMMQSVLTQLAIGNSYSTPPRMFMRLTVGQVNEDVRVQPYVWTETQMPFGQMQQMQLNGDAMQNDLFGFLGNAGGQLPVGTTFPNAAYLGGQGAMTQVVNGRRTMVGYRVDSLVESGPGARMGLQRGDIIVRVNRRTFRDEAGFDDRMSDARVGQPLTIVVMRGGEEVTLTGTAEARPPIQWLIRRGQQGSAASLFEAQLVSAMHGERPAPVEVATTATSASDDTPSSVAEAEARLRAAQAAARVAEAEAELAAARAAAAAQAPAEPR